MPHSCRVYELKHSAGSRRKLTEAMPGKKRNKRNKNKTPPKSQSRGGGGGGSKGADSKTVDAGASGRAAKAGGNKLRLPYKGAKRARRYVDFFVVMDFEATCDEQEMTVPREIIEFPAVLVDAQARAREANRRDSGDI
jgi:hypothetical protein